MWLIQSLTTMWLIQKSHYDVANSMPHYDVANLMSHYDVANSMSHYDVANSKPATMQHYLQSPLLDGISKALYDPTSLKAWYDPAPLKARCYTTPFTKPVAIRQYFTKSQNHFHKGQILIWQTILQSSNSNLATIFLKPKY